MEDKKPEIEAYQKMNHAMVQKDATGRNEVMDDSFTLVHMTGMRQSKRAFIQAVMNGTLNYYSALHENVSVEIVGDTALLIGQSNVVAAVFGGRRSRWRLQQKCRLEKTDGTWKIIVSVASIY